MLQRLVKANKISSRFAERVKTHYSSFFDVVDSNVTAFKDFSKENDRLGSFFADFIGTDKNYADIWEVCKNYVDLVSWTSLFRTWIYGK